MALGYKIWAKPCVMKKPLFFKFVLLIIVFYVCNACFKPGHFTEDSDDDGVPDYRDLCPDTFEDEPVDEYGCALDRRTYVPDDNFEQYLIDLGHDDILDDYVTTSNINTLEELILEGNAVNDVSDLTGIQDFISLVNLRIVGQPITGSLDIAILPNLEHLFLRNLEISSLIVSEHSSLESLYFDVRDNPITQKLYILNNSSLADVEILYANPEALHVIGNMELVRLKLRVVNSPNPIRVYDNVILETLILEETGFDNIDLVNNNVLSRIICQDCPDVSLDFAAVPSLIELNILSGTLTSLNITGNINLNTLIVTAETLTSFDVSQNTMLENLSAQSGGLVCIKVNQDQLNAIPPGWSTFTADPYALDCP